jgi:hypothetical protein
MLMPRAEYTPLPSRLGRPTISAHNGLDQFVGFQNFVSDFQVSPTHAIHGMDGGEVRCADGVLPIGLMSRISLRPRMDPRSGPTSDTSILHTWRIYDSLQCLRFSSNCDRRLRPRG